MNRNPIRVLIIDDEPIAIEVIKELATQLTADLAIEGTATNGMDAVQKISSLKPDLVFMDVDMPYMNGMEVLKNLSYKEFQTIFTTGFESQELKSLKHEAIDYLLKPIDPAEFLEVVEKVRKKLATQKRPATDSQ
jgi:two-component system, LytTR family, response regulator